MATTKPLILMILDGYGVNENKRGNACAQAHTPNLERYKAEFPMTTLVACGEAVGLPEGQMGNSEVGHLNIGAGRTVYQDLSRITVSIREGEFFQNPVLLKVINQAKSKDKALHLMGLLSDGGVHSHIAHLFAIMDMAAQHGLEKIYVHAFLDGRDVPPANAMEYITPLEQKCQSLGTGCIATIMGRYYAMDRDKRWDRVEKAYQAMVLGEGIKANSASAAIQLAYDRKETDEFVQPTVVTDASGQPVAKIAEGDAVIFFNFRPDRAREITRAFVDQEFDGFQRPQDRPQVDFVCFTTYDKTIDAPVAFGPQELKNTLGEVLAKNNLRQLRIAETEKYAHVTFFFSGGVETPYELEDRLLIPSPKVATYDLQPEMSAFEVTEALLDKIHQNLYDVIILNFANPDMVGHTGKMGAAVQAMEAVDKCVGQVVEAALAQGGAVLLTADHGNCEVMVDEQGHEKTSHTTNVVPFVVIGEQYKDRQLRPGSLKDIAPTMLKILGIQQPEEMTGQLLFAE